MDRKRARQPDRKGKPSTSGTKKSGKGGKGKKFECKQKAAQFVQRNYRGYLVRKYLAKAKEKAMKRCSDFRAFINNYRDHLTRMSMRHEKDPSKMCLDFKELYKYTETLMRSDIVFNRFAKGDKMPVTEFTNLLKELNHVATQENIDLSIAKTMTEKGESGTVTELAKIDVTEVVLDLEFTGAFKPPKREPVQSSWLHPVVAGQDAASLNLALTAKDMKQTSFKKCFNEVKETKRERETVKAMVERNKRFEGQLQSHYKHIESLPK